MLKSNIQWRGDRMKICGLQKTTLLDFPQRVACTVFTGGCNFSCPFCHNATLAVGDIFEEVISEEEFFAFLEKRKGVLDGVCITGGEPTIQKRLEEFIRKIKDKGYQVKLDTNGSFPDILKHLVIEGLVDYVAMDIKSSRQSYDVAIGNERLDIKKVNESIDFLKENHIDFEFRTTAVKGIHSKNDFEEIGKWLKGDVKYYIQNYIDSGDTIAERKGKNNLLKGFSTEEIEGFAKIVGQYIPKTRIRGI